VEPFLADQPVVAQCAESGRQRAVVAVVFLEEFAVEIGFVGAADLVGGE
jgi:hypothetical protein